MQITPPAPVSAAYSEMDMRIHLATASSVNVPCEGDQCILNQQFDQRVQQLGSSLAVAAFDAYPDLSKRISQFQFVVAEKEKPGSTSNASGKIVIFRGTQNLDVGDETLAFMIAREMAHLIGHHHDENSATRILFSVLAGVIFPAANLFGGSAAAAQATSITSSATVATAAASTATSIVGSEVVLASIKPDQMSEADTIAIGLLDKLGWNTHDVASALQSNLHLEGKDSWSKDMLISVGHVLALDETGHTQENPQILVEDVDMEPEPSLAAQNPATTEQNDQLTTQVEPLAPATAPTEMIFPVKEAFLEKPVDNSKQMASLSNVNEPGLSDQPPIAIKSSPLKLSKNPVKHRVSKKQVIASSSRKTSSAGSSRKLARSAKSASVKFASNNARKQSRHQSKGYASAASSGAPFKARQIRTTPPKMIDLKRSAKTASLKSVSTLE